MPAAAFKRFDLKDHLTVWESVAKYLGSNGLEPWASSLKTFLYKIVKIDCQSIIQIQSQSQIPHMFVHIVKDHKLYIIIFHLSTNFEIKIIYLMFVFNPKWDMHWLRAKEIKDSPNSQAVPKILVLLKIALPGSTTCSGSSYFSSTQLHD